MASEERDPREAVIVDIICEEGRCEGSESPAGLLARIDRADPLRAMLGDVVADDEDLPCGCGEHYGGCDCFDSEYSFREGVAVGRNQMRKEIRDILARPRTLTPTEGDAP